MRMRRRNERPEHFLRRFMLIRHKDESGVSGTGIVAYGAQLPSGRCIMEWVVKFSSLTVFSDIGSVEGIHSHDGATEVVWIDTQPKLADKTNQT